MPKEMLLVVDRPLIQHVVVEAREAGIEHFIFVTGRNKAVIEDHFDRQKFFCKNVGGVLLVSWGLLVIAPPLAGSFEMRCTVPA